MTFGIEIIAAVIILALGGYIDWKEHRVPNWLTFSAWIAGFVFQIVTYGWAGLIIWTLGSLAGFGTLIILYALAGMGAGDVKLMAAVGGWIGWNHTLHGFLWIVIVGGIMGLYIMIRSPEFKERLKVTLEAGKNLATLKNLDTGVKNAPKRIDLPYGVPIAIGFYAYFIFGGII